MGQPLPGSPSHGRKALEPGQRSLRVMRAILQQLAATMDFDPRLEFCGGPRPKPIKSHTPIPCEAVQGSPSRNRCKKRRAPVPRSGTVLHLRALLAPGSLSEKQMCRRERGLRVQASGLNGGSTSNSRHSPKSARFPESASALNRCAIARCWAGGNQLRAKRYLGGKLRLED